MVIYAPHHGLGFPELHARSTCPAGTLGRLRVPNTLEVGWALRLKVLGRLVEIAGFRKAHVEDPAKLIEELRGLEELEGVAFQLLDADMVAGEEHLLISAFNAIRAFEMGLNVSSDLGIEALTFASAQRQIAKAIKLMGLKPGEVDIAVLLIASSEEAATRALEAIGKALGAERDDGVLGVDEEKAKRIAEAFGLSEAELSACSRLGRLAEAVKALVLERVALSIVYR